MRSSWGRIAWLLPTALLFTACDNKAKEELTRRVNEANDKLLQCRKETNDLKNEVSSLKRQLAQAMANPSRVVLTDPEIINLIASIKGTPVAGAEGKGGFDGAQGSKIVMQGAHALRQCYERALKKNQALQFQSGIGITLALTIRAQGTVQNVDVTPSVDAEMTSCIKNTAMRWKFPTFTGDDVIVEQKLTLTPTKT
jgi:hypothetical protein